MGIVSTHRLYVIHFDDDRIKFGISKQVSRRMKYYEQEAKRNRVNGFTWWASPEFSCRKDASMVEGLFRRVLADSAFAGHLEWINGGSQDFSQIIGWGEELSTKFRADGDLGLWGRFGRMPGQEAMQ